MNESIEVPPKIDIIRAFLGSYPIIQNMARFYIYDRTKYMGWKCPDDGLFECIDFKHYFQTSGKKAFLVKVDGELAGFFLIDEIQLAEPIDSNLAEFFILAKFQGKGIALKVAEWIFEIYPGRWSVAVMPENLKAVKFWRKTIARISGNQFTEVLKTKEELKTAESPASCSMAIFSFKTK